MVWASPQTKKKDGTTRNLLPVCSPLSPPSPLTAPRPTPGRSGPPRTSATPATCTGARRSTLGGPSTSSPRYRPRWSTPGSSTATGEAGPWGTRGDRPKDFNICLFVCLYWQVQVKGHNISHKLLWCKCLLQSLYLLMPCLTWYSAVHSLTLCCDLEHLLVVRWA